jgi:DNA-binding CsgD family transcriptional regulator
MTLLERDDSFAVLACALKAAQTTGQLVAVCGEAGIGKSSLLQAFGGRDATMARVLWGYCEALGTPRPLGPLLDMAPGLEGRTAEALAARAPRHDLFAAFVDDLTQSAAQSATPIVTVFEDIHWADVATLDLLQYVGRRISHTRAVVVVSWRDEEVSADHAMHRVLGEWPHAAVHRIQLRPLSLPAIEQLAAGRRDAAAVHALTGGNPFFVTEVLSAEADTVPASVREAVLARRARLDAPARAVLDFVSVVPSKIELSLVLATLDPSTRDLEACVEAGLLRCEPRSLSFRHELARRAVADALSAPRVQDCHRRVLQALLARPDREQLLARIVHHAEACGDLDALLEYAPAAARQAAALGAHRQAVDHYQRALEYADGLSREVRAGLTEALAYELYLTGDLDAARDARRDALESWQRLDVSRAVGRNVRWLSRLAWFAGDREEAERRADEAIAVLRELPESDELAMAFSNRSQLDMLSNDLEPCIAWGTRAIDLARTLGARDVLSHALNNVGTVRLLAGEPEGRTSLEESLRLALAGDLHEHAARAYSNLSSCAVQRRDYGEARRWLDAGLCYCAERDLDSWALYMQAWRARLLVETGLWHRACDDADKVLTAPRVPTVSRIAALAALGLVRVRRGDPHARRPLDEALALARRTAEPQRLLPVLLALAELAWLTGRHADVEAAVREGLTALGPDKRAFDREPLWYWRWKIDARRDPETPGDGPYAQLMRGDWRTAAASWQRLGCPYERGLALVEGDVPAVREALDIFLTLGAAPAADRARQRLRQMGLTRVPRGRRPGTRAHPAGLTAREAETLAMLALGLRNPQIADRLFVSPKTIEHHVSSILAKLEVSTRDAAVVHARQQGWLTDRRHAVRSSPAPIALSREN